MIRRISVLFALAVGLASCMPVFAQSVTIPSAASGDYEGAGYSCRLIAQTYTQPGQSIGQNGIEVRCRRPSNEQTIGLTIGPQACPSEFYRFPLSQWGGGDQVPGKLAPQFESVTFTTVSGETATAYGYSIAQKFPATWGRITSIGASYEYIDMMIGSDASVLLFTAPIYRLIRSQPIAPSAPYPGCALPETKPAFDICRVIGCRG